ncbi:MAG: metallophosphatase family protein [Lentimicrobiaceae bacterium]|jgi:putative phosphoesterase|nr:metallophosphatase family protein [Lentimicrobiaceae bacterium]
MTKIGLLSDTHGWLHPRVFDFFASCNLILHAGDIGSVETADQLAKFKPLYAVYGNIDGHQLRIQFSEKLLFEVESCKILMTHIGGYPGHYAKGISDLIRQHKPDIFVSGHSHILKVIPDKKNKLLHINPGAAGRNGLHHKITMIRFAIDGKAIQDMEILEINRDQALT